MTTKASDAFIDELWADLSAQRRHFTNAKFAGYAMQLVSWNPITSAKYDTGVLSASGDSLTLLWAADDDQPPSTRVWNPAPVLPVALGGDAAAVGIFSAFSAFWESLSPRPPGFLPAKSSPDWTPGKFSII